MGDISVCLNRDDWELTKRKLGQSVYVFLGPWPPFAVSTKTRSSSRLPSWPDSKTWGGQTWIKRPKAQPAFFMLERVEVSCSLSLQM